MWKANFVQLFATTFYLYDLLKVALKHVKKQFDSKIIQWFMNMRLLKTTIIRAEFKTCA